jgi:hypothetical protein
MYVILQLLLIRGVHFNNNRYVMNKSHKSYRAHNKENINEVECEMKDLQSKYCEMSRYFESRIQK